MPRQKFRKLEVELPKQKLFNQKPWLIAGLILAFVVLLFIAIAFVTK